MSEAENNADRLVDWSHAKMSGIDNEKDRIAKRTGTLSLNDEGRPLAGGSVATPQGERYKQKLDRDGKDRVDKPSQVGRYFDEALTFNEPETNAVVMVTKELKARLRSLLVTTGTESEPSPINELINQFDRATDRAIAATQESQRSQGETLGRREFHGLQHIAETWGNLFELQATLNKYGLSIDKLAIADALLALAYHDVVQTVGGIADKEGNALEPAETIKWLNQQQSVEDITSQGVLMRQRVGGGQIEAESAKLLIEAISDEILSPLKETDRQYMTEMLTAAIMATQPGYNSTYSVHQINLVRPALSPPELKPSIPKEEALQALQVWQGWQTLAERVRALVAFADLGTSAMQPELALRQGLALRFEDSLELNRLLSRTLELADTAELSSENLLSAWKKDPEFATAIRERVRTWLGVQVNFIEGQRLQLTQSKPENADATVPNPPRYSLDLLFENLDWGDIKEDQKQTIIDQFKQELSERLEDLKQQNRELIQAINQPEGGLQLLAERIAEALKPSYSLAKPRLES